MNDGNDLAKAGSVAPTVSGDIAQIEAAPRFTVSDIPLFLFNELSRHFGVGEEEYWKNPENDNYTKNRDLDPTHPHIGFKARISFGKIRETASLGLWDKDVLEYDRHHESSSYPLFYISAGIRSAGIWTYGHGNLMAESGSVRFRMEDFSLQSPSLRLIGLITFRASQMATNSACVSGDRYWQAERNPASDYTRPSF